MHLRSRKKQLAHRNYDSVAAYFPAHCPLPPFIPTAHQTMREGQGMAGSLSFIIGEFPAGCATTARLAAGAGRQPSTLPAAAAAAALRHPPSPFPASLWQWQRLAGSLHISSTQGWPFWPLSHPARPAQARGVLLLPSVVLCLAQQAAATDPPPLGLGPGWATHADARASGMQRGNMGHDGWSWGRGIKSQWALKHPGPSARCCGQH